MTSRRTLLRTVALSTAVGAVGCIDQNDENSDEEVSHVNDNDDADDTEGGIGEPTFEVVDVSGSDYELGANVAFENDVVGVSGTISGNDSCYSARLHSVELGGRTLTVRVESFDAAAADEICMEILVGITYELTVPIIGEPPDEVVVKHNGDRVQTAQR